MRFFNHILFLGTASTIAVEAALIQYCRSLTSVHRFAPGNWLKRAFGRVSIIPKETSVQTRTIIERRKLWASKSLHVRTKLVESPTKYRPDRTEHRSGSTIDHQSIFPNTCDRHQDHLPWHGSQRCLVQEARCIVAIEERRGIEHATRQILQIDAGEAVGGSCVSSDPKDTRVGSVADLEVCDYLDDVVLRSRRATVPI